MNREERERLGGRKGLARQAAKARVRDNIGDAIDSLVEVFIFVTNGCISGMNHCACAFNEGYAGDANDRAEYLLHKATKEAILAKLL